MASVNLSFGNVNRNLYKHLENFEIAEAKSLINTNFSRIISESKEWRGFISLVIKYYIIINDSSNLDLIYQSHKSNLMKRDILRYVNYYYHRDLTKSIHSFSFLKDNYFLDSKNIDYLITNKMFILIKMLDGFYTKATDSNHYKYFYGEGTLRKVPFDTEVIKDTLVKIKKNINIEHIENFIESTRTLENKVIIDAGNVLFSTAGMVTLNGYNHLIKLIERVIERREIPIVVIHNRHLKIKDTSNKTLSDEKQSLNKLINKIKNMSGVYILETPYKQNDDFYIIYLGLLYQSKIITRDNFKDHIFTFKTNKEDSDENMILNYIDELLVKYNLEGREIIPWYPKKYSKCIQVLGNEIYIPTKNGKMAIFSHT